MQNGKYIKYFLANNSSENIIKDSILSNIHWNKFISPFLRFFYASPFLFRNKFCIHGHKKGYAKGIEPMFSNMIGLMQWMKTKCWHFYFINCFYCMNIIFNKLIYFKYKNAIAIKSHRIYTIKLNNADGGIRYRTSIYLKCKNIRFSIKIIFASSS